MKQIFISYAQADEGFAVRLAQDLREDGAQTWIDILNAEPGRLWTRSIERALSESHMLIVVISPAALDTAHVAVEWQAYLEAHRPVVPVIAQDCHLPGPLRTRRPIDFSRESLYPRAVHQLMNRLLEYGLRTYRSDPVIWDINEDVRRRRTPPPPQPASAGFVAAGELADAAAQDLAAGALRRMVSGLRDMLLGRDSAG